MSSMKNKSTELDGRMTSETTDINSTEYREALEVLLNRAQNRTPEDQLLVEMTALEVRMKKYLENPSVKKKDLYQVQDFFKEMLDAAHISQNKLANYIGYQPSNLSTMFKNGKVNYEIAKILESIFHISYTLWLDIQSKNKAIVDSKKNIKTFGDYSYKELIS